MGEKTDKPELKVVPPSKPEARLPTIELHMECMFREIKESLVYPLPKTDEERIQSVLQSDKKVFLAITTLDWRNVFINLQFLNECQLWTALHYPVERAGGVMKCGYADGRLSEHGDVDLQYLESLSISLDTMDEPMDRFLSIPMESGGELLLNTAELVFLEYPDYWHDLADEELDAD